ncbi:hypothetical protein E2C01_021685 [Portunus trituberculatus]|uniref:Uncharacterized protein n=1 Tax=Portunus trituberculatus TaxID=210409 RepID=A0A5B7E4Y6_PORTR|nr:hypothetical protein [Portunus trituberculatus]
MNEPEQSRVRWRRPTPPELLGGRKPEAPSLRERLQQGNETHLRGRVCRVSLVIIDVTQTFEEPGVSITAVI